MRGFWCGTVEFEALGGFPERFLNEAEADDVTIWNARRTGAVLYGECRAADYARLRPAVRKSGVRLRVKRRRGLPFLVRPFWPRPGLVTGGIAALILLQMLSARVWVITVNGNQTVPTETVLSVLASLGVHTGTVFEEVDLAHLQLESLRQLPTVGWLSVNQKGSVLTVTVKETEPSVPKEETAPADMVAAADGTIVHIAVTSGQAMVKEGDTVARGDVLIRGQLDSEVGPMLRRARGTVTARVIETVTVFVPYDEPVPCERVTAVRPTAVFFGLAVPLYTGGETNGREVQERRWLRVRGRELPIGLTVTKRVVDETCVVHRTGDEALAEARLRLAAEEEGWVQQTVESRAVSEELTAEGVTVTGQYTVLRELGEIREIIF